MRSKIFTRTVGYWPLQESSGQALDYSGNENHASSTSVSSYGASGPVGSSAMSFDGSSNIEIPYIGDTFIPSNAFTAASWINIGSNGSQTVLNGQEEYDVRVIRFDENGNQKIGMATWTGNDNDVFSESSLSLDQWYFVTVVYDGDGTVRIYLNGDLDNEGTISTSWDSDSDNIRIGVDKGSGYFDGKIAHVRVWDYPLPEASIRALYNASKGGFSQSDSRTL